MAVRAGRRVPLPPGPSRSCAAQFPGGAWLLAVAVDRAVEIRVVPHQAVQHADTDDGHLDALARCHTAAREVGVLEVLEPATAAVLEDGTAFSPGAVRHVTCS